MKFPKHLRDSLRKTGPRKQAAREGKKSDETWGEFGCNTAGSSSVAGKASEELFKHEPLRHERQSIRLVCFRELFVEDIDLTIAQFRLEVDAASAGSTDSNNVVVKAKSDYLIPRYKTLSYTWGDPLAKHRILLNGRPFLVRQNLWDFLHSSRDRARKSPDEAQWLWIDQICINQSTFDEKNHQVQIMADIYRRAESVIVWLGLATLEDTLAIRILTTPIGHEKFRQDLHHLLMMDASFRAAYFKSRRMEETPLNMKALQTEEEPSHLVGFLDQCVQSIYAKPYWTRVWIVQEVMCCPNRVLWCGLFEFHFEDIERYETLRARPTHELKIPKVILWAWDTNTEKFNWRIFGRLLHDFSKHECENPRDRIYGFQGLFPKYERLQVDYSKSPDDIAMDAYMHWITWHSTKQERATTDAEYLTTASIWPDDSRQQLQALTTWLLSKEEWLRYRRDDVDQRMRRKEVTRKMLEDVLAGGSVGWRGRIAEWEGEGVNLDYEEDEMPRSITDADGRYGHGLAVP